MPILLLTRDHCTEGNFSAMTDSARAARTTTTMALQQMKRRLLQCYFICHVTETRASTSLTSSTAVGDLRDSAVVARNTPTRFKMGSMSIIHSGWLQKMPHASHTFSKCRKRWFVLRLTKDERYVLEYFNEASSTKAKGLFIFKLSRVSIR